MKRFLILLLTLTVLLGACIFPTVAFAGENSLDNLNVQVTNDGKVSVSGSQFDSSNSSSVWNDVFTRFKGVITGVSGFCFLIFVLIFVILFSKLSVYSDNEIARKRTLVGLLFTGIAAAGCGSVGLFVGFFYNLLQ